MEFIKHLLFCGYISLVISVNYSGKFTTSSYTWSNARDANRLVGYDLTGKLSDIHVTLDGSSSNSAYGWIDGQSAYQPWFEYLGCYVISSTKVRKSLTVNSGTQVLDCVNGCSSAWSYIGIQQTTCVCLDTILANTSNEISQCAFCTADTYSLCASDNQTTLQYAVYKRSPDLRVIRSGVGGCLLLTINRNLSPSVYYEPAPCTTGLKPLCFKSGSTYYYNTGNNWNGAFETCKSAGGVLTSPFMIAGSSILTPDGSYWLAQIRKSQFYLYKDFITGSENFCLAARVMANGYLDIIERSCDTALPGLYYTNITGTPVPNVPNTTDTGGPRIKKEPPPLSDGLIATAVFIPSMVVVSIVAVVGWFVYKYCKCCNQTSEISGKFAHFEQQTSSFEASERVSEEISKIQNSESEYYEPEETYYVIGSDTYTEVQDAYNHTKQLPLNTSLNTSYAGEDHYSGSNDTGSYHTLTRDNRIAKDTEKEQPYSSTYHTLTRGNNLGDGSHVNNMSTYDRMSSIRRAQNKTGTNESRSSSDSLKNASGNYDTVVLNEKQTTDNYDIVSGNDNRVEEEDDQYDHLDNVI